MAVSSSPLSGYRCIMAKEFEIGGRTLKGHNMCIYSVRSIVPVKPARTGEFGTTMIPAFFLYWSILLTLCTYYSPSVIFPLISSYDAAYNGIIVISRHQWYPCYRDISLMHSKITQAFYISLLWVFYIRTNLKKFWNEEYLPLYFNRFSCLWNAFPPLELPVDALRTLKTIQY